MKEWPFLGFTLTCGQIQAGRFFVGAPSPSHLWVISRWRGTVGISLSRDERERLICCLCVLWYPDHVCFELQYKSLSLSLVRGPPNARVVVIAEIFALTENVALFVH